MSPFSLLLVYPSPLPRCQRHAHCNFAVLFLAARSSRYKEVIVRPIIIQPLGNRLTTFLVSTPMNYSTRETGCGGKWRDVAAHSNHSSSARHSRKLGFDFKSKPKYWINRNGDWDQPEGSFPLPPTFLLLLLLLLLFRLFHLIFKSAHWCHRISLMWQPERKTEQAASPSGGRLAKLQTNRQRNKQTNTRSTGPGAMETPGATGVDYSDYSGLFHRQSRRYRCGLTSSWSW